MYIRCINRRQAFRMVSFRYIFEARVFNELIASFWYVLPGCLVFNEQIKKSDD